MKSSPPPWRLPVDKALGYLGLAARAGRLTVGTEDCVKESRRRTGGLIVAASDAGESALRQAAFLAGQGRGRAFRCGYTKQELGRAAGRAGPVALAIIWDEGLAKAFEAAAIKDRGRQEERV